VSHVGKSDSILNIKFNSVGEYKRKTMTGIGRLLILQED
jgi:hypothetical protein